MLPSWSSGSESPLCKASQYRMNLKSLNHPREKHPISRLIFETLVDNDEESFLLCVFLSICVFNICSTLHKTLLYRKVSV